MAVKIITKIIAMGIMGTRRDDRAVARPRPMMLFIVPQTGTRASITAKLLSLPSCT